MAEAVTPKPAAPKRTPHRCEIKMFRVELSARGDAAIPLGWTPFAVHTLPGIEVQNALIWAYK